MCALSSLGAGAAPGCLPLLCAAAVRWGAWVLALLANWVLVTRCRVPLQSAAAVCAWEVGASAWFWHRVRISLGPVAL